MAAVRLGEIRDHGVLRNAEMTQAIFSRTRLSSSGQSKPGIGDIVEFHDASKGIACCQNVEPIKLRGCLAKARDFHIDKAQSYKAKGWEGAGLAVVAIMASHFSEAVGASSLWRYAFFAGAAYGIWGMMTNFTPKWRQAAYASTDDKKFQKLKN